MTSLLFRGQGLFFDTFHGGNDASPPGQPLDIRTKTSFGRAWPRTFFYFGEDHVNRIKFTSYRLLVIIAVVVLSGCAMTTPSFSSSRMVASLSYEIPASIDVTRIIDMLEASSTKVLRRPMIMDEPTSSPMAAKTASAFYLQEKVMSLKGLGKIAIPSIICPGALASMHTLISDTTGLRLIAACVVGNDGGTRLHLAEAVTVEPSLFGLSHKAAESFFLSHIGVALIERLPGIHLVEPPVVPNHGMSDSTGGVEVTASGDLARGESSVAVYHKDASIHASPVVCFSPKENGTAVREHPGSNRVVGTLGSDLILQEEDPSKNSFLHVTTREGRNGWVKRSDVRWIPCPLA